MARVSVNLPKDMLEDIDDLAEEVETDRTEIIQGLLAYALANVDDVFPYEEEGEEEEEAESEE